MSIIKQLFLEQVKLRPDKVAVISQNKQLTYLEVYQLVTRLSENIAKELDVKSIDCVPILVNRNDDILIAILAVLSLEIPYVPLDANMPSMRLSNILNDVNAKVILTSGQKLPETCDRFTQIDITKLKNMDTDYVKPIDKKNEKSFPAYIIYTSGTTGKPKGVQIPQSAVLNLVQGLQHFYQLTHEDIVLQFASISFDVHVAEIFLALSVGATIIIANEEMRQSPNNLHHCMFDYKVSFAILPPLLVTMLPKIRLPHLKCLTVTGELAPKQILDYWPKHTRVFNAYGPTEATVFTTIAEIKSDSSVNNIGKPLAGYMCCLVKVDQLVKDNTEGELLIGGYGLATGYINSPEETNKKFIYFDINNQKLRLYKTGDIVKRDDNGDLHYLKREDDQVKIRGYRVELKEIENLTVSINAVIQAVAITIGNDIHKKIYLFYTAKKSRDTTSEINRHLKKNLPDYMIPTDIICIDQLPTTHAGKLDKVALEKLVVNKSNIPVLTTQAKSKPITEILATYKEVLATDDITASSDFFELGGNSLLAVELLAKLNNRLHSKLVIRDIYEYGTPELLVNRV